MSGLEVIGAISAVVGIIEACVKIYDSAAKDLKLSETFRAVAYRLPILADTLTTCKTYLEPRKGSIPADACKALEDILESCEERARNLRTIFEKVVTTETDGWDKRYVKVVRRLGKGNKVEELMAMITKDVQLVVNHRAVQSAQPEQRQQLEQILQDLQQLESSLDDDGGAGTNFTNWYGRQYVNPGDGQQFIYDSMSGTQNFNLVIRQKLDFSFIKPAGPCLGRAPHIDRTLFVGRAAEISQIHHVLRPEKSLTEQRRLVLGGMGGIGKTQLAIAYARQMRDSYDSIFWADASRKDTLKASFLSMAESIFDLQDIQRLNSEQVVAGVKQWLSDTKNTKWLLIFDNYDEPQSYDLTDCYPPASHGSVIITTRLPDEVGPEALVVQSISNIEESLEILETRSKREKVREDFHAQRLAERLAGLPLALATAGAFLHKDKSTETFAWYLREYEKRWNINPQRPLRLSEYRGRTLYTTWDLSYRRLEQEAPEAAQMLKLLAYFGQQSIWYDLLHAGKHDELPEWLVAVAGDSVEFGNVMRTLVDYCFVEVQSGTQTYTIHTCVHDWTLNGLNQQIESWSYWYAFDCVAESIVGERWEDLKHLPYAQFVPHAIRLAHSKFAGAISEMEEDQISGAEDIAQLLHEQTQLNTAELILCSVLTYKKEALGPDHTSTLRTVHNLGNLYRGQGRLDEAEQMYSRVLSLYRGPDIEARWWYTITNHAAVLSQGVRLAKDEQAALSRLARLVRHVDTWGGRGNPTRMCYLTKVLISIKDDANAQIAIVQEIKAGDRTTLDFSGIRCDGCQCEITLTPGRYMCRSCEDVDVCNACMSTYKNKRSALWNCSGHEFFDTGSTVSEMLKSSEIENTIGADVWMDKLKKQYYTEQEVLPCEDLVHH
ncbi:hypothetical protein LTS08_008757 [Lithohypha guttulata]|uniref:NACHT-NTPase and P-loop NTPases N-terminal domain-containing protein n=1 Tax=Lithohypha guttulata TaxID=1690604 RepID=A0AAN7PJF6_9EURO|nr:hypothetical protein LTR05_008750 [Lithohypha guttulata]KAK5094074.1 hypothetical protein LTS08_008757 [Lithohypha guttulata]